MNADTLALAVMDDDGFGCAITTSPAAPDLAAYLAAKDHYERLIAYRGVRNTPAPITAIRAAEARLDAMKAAAGWGGPRDPLCCQRYSFLHHPVFSVTGCRWYEYKTQTAKGRA